MAQYAKARVPQLPLTNFAAHRSPAALAARYVTRKGTDLRLASARPLSPGSASPAGVPVLYCHRRPKGFSAHTTIDDVALVERASISLHRQLRSAVCGAISADRPPVQRSPARVRGVHGVEAL